MTVIAGVVDGSTVLIGGDSAGVAGYELTVRADPKTFVVGPFAYGFTTSFRMGQIIRHAFQPPTPPSDGELEGFMCTTFVDALRSALRTAGWSRVENQQETGGTFLIGVRGRLFCVQGDFQVGEARDGYDAVGCGADVANGALYATQGTGMSAEDRVLTALRAAERHSAGVRGPFTLTRG